MARDAQVAPTPVTGTPVKPPSRAALVVLVATFALVIVYAIDCIVGKTYKNLFFAMPFVPGFIVGVSSLRRPYLNGLIALVAGLLLAVAWLREGVACVLMALPILIPVSLIGTFLGHVTRRYLHTRKARVAAATLVALAQVGGQSLQSYLDDPSTHPWHEVRNEVAVEASPEAVFKALVGGAVTVDGPWPAVLSVGLPIPRRMRVERPGLGGSVRFDFNHGTAWGEIVGWEEGRAFAFEIKRYDIKDPPYFHTRLSGDEHFGLKTERVTDWLTFGKLSYLIAPRPEGGVLLTRETRFQRHLFPDFYFGWLEETVVRAGGTRLLEQLKRRAEAPTLDVSAAGGGR